MDARGFVGVGKGGGDGTGTGLDEDEEDDEEDEEDDGIVEIKKPRRGELLLSAISLGGG